MIIADERANIEKEVGVAVHFMSRQVRMLV